MKYVCEHCYAVFHEESECKEHEKSCKEKKPIKAIAIDSGEYIVATYPSATIRGDTIRLLPNFTSYLRKERLEKMIRGNQRRIIYTTDMSKEKELECFKKIIESEIISIKKEIKTLEETLSAYEKDTAEKASESARRISDLLIEEL